MTDQAQIEDLVAANHILSDQGVVDGFGHVSARHEEEKRRFLLARSMAPGLVTADDITMADLETEAFRQIATPKKKFVVLPSTSHMTLYSNLSALDVAALAASDWFARYVLNPPSLATVLDA